MLDFWPLLSNGQIQVEDSNIVAFLENLNCIYPQIKIKEKGI